MSMLGIFIMAVLYMELMRFKTCNDIITFIYLSKHYSCFILFC